MAMSALTALFGYVGFPLVRGVKPATSVMLPAVGKLKSTLIILVEVSSVSALC